MYYLKVWGYRILWFCLAAVSSWGVLAMVSGYAKWVSCFYLILLIFLFCLAINFWKAFFYYVIFPHESVGHKYPWGKTMLNPCQELRTCEICDHKEVVGEHKMQKHVKKGQHPCQEYLKCKKCGLEDDKGINHNFGSPIFRTDGTGKPCELIRRCNGCGLELPAGIDHDFGSSVLRPEGSGNPCELIKTCKRCGLEEVTGINHEYETLRTKVSDCISTAKCKRCGTEGSFSNHDFSAYPYGECHFVQTCTKCGAEETIWLDHDPVYDSYYGMRFCSRCGEMC